MKKFQGEDIYFSLNFTSVADGSITSFNDLDNVIVYAYTSDKNIVKFSRTKKDGYEPLIPVGTTGMTLKGVINSKYTVLMAGQIMIDIMCIRESLEGDMKENMIQTSVSGIFIVPSLIKNEAQ